MPGMWSVICSIYLFLQHNKEITLKTVFSFDLISLLSKHYEGSFPQTKSQDMLQQADNPQVDEPTSLTKRVRIHNSLLFEKSRNK